MRILFYAHSSTLYGANTSLINLLAGLKLLDKSLELHIIVPKETALIESLISENISYSIINHYYWIYDNELYQEKIKKDNSLGKAWKFKNKWQKRLKNHFLQNKHLKFVKEFSPDLIYVNSSLSPMGAYIANKLSIPFVWHHRETINDPVTSYYLDNTMSFKYYFKKASLHIYPSTFLRNYYKELFPEIASNDQIVKNGVAFLKDLPSQNPKRKNSKIKFGIVGRVNKQKGQKEVIDVFSRLNKNFKKNPLNNSFPELHIIGGGIVSYVNELKIKYNYDYIKFRGFVSSPYIFADIDYLIINARNESFGRVVAEANFLGIPVIALKSGALPELIKEGENGYLFENSDELLNIIKRVANLDLDQYEKLSASSQSVFSERFSIEQYSKEILAEINKLKI